MQIGNFDNSVFALILVLSFLIDCASSQTDILLNSNKIFGAPDRRPNVILSIEDHKTVDSNGLVREDYFKAVKQLYANTISVTFRWSFFEKQFDHYDTSILRSIKKCAQKYDLKVILLWFGSNICGHENCVPDYIRCNPGTYIPYTRGDGSIASKIDDPNKGTIFCYSFDEKQKNYLLEREKKALRHLMQWILRNDKDTTFIMLQLGNELFVNPELWRPWPPICLTPMNLHAFHPNECNEVRFAVSACSLKIEANIYVPKNCTLEINIIDSLDKSFWRAKTTLSGKQELRIGGKEFINILAKLESKIVGEIGNDTVDIKSIKITPIAERCHCARCEYIFQEGGFSDDQKFQQFVMRQYIRQLASAVKEVYPKLPVYLNLLISGDAKNLIGNPFYSWKTYLDSVPEINFVAPDIYYEDLVSLLDTFDVGRNIIFVPEAGQMDNVNEQTFLNAFSLIFYILGKYRGIGIQIYNLYDSPFSLITNDGKWKKQAYLLRNSFAVVNMLPINLIINPDVQVQGFRNLSCARFQFGDCEAEITSIKDSIYARGLIIKADKKIIIGGIGFRARLFLKNAKLRKIERGIWIDNKYLRAGELKTNTYSITSGSVIIKMDEDDFSEPKRFQMTGKQYIVVIEHY